LWHGLKGIVNTAVQCGQDGFSIKNWGHQLFLHLRRPSVVPSLSLRIKRLEVSWPRSGLRGFF
ncbi:hypothetical protein, partial [Deinococcus frigens]|uniref:hypothetical protein n=1 Tax=Deinococcus frigens TaxID=249403 RepID=UPI0039F0699A